MAKEIKITGDFTGNISIGDNEINGKKVTGTHIDGVVTERKTKKEKEKSGVDDGIFTDRSREELETYAKKVKLANNQRCDITINEPDEVGITQCERCTITIHEPKVLVVVNCVRCDVTIYTSDPEKITFVDTDNDERTTFTFLDPADDEEWDWPPDDEEDDDDEKQAPTSSGISVGGKISGSRMVQGDGIKVDKQTMGPELPVGSEVLLPPGLGVVIRNSSHNTTNLTGVWELQRDEITGQPLEKQGQRVYVRTQ